MKTAMDDFKKISVLPTQTNSAAELAEQLLHRCVTGKTRHILVVELEEDLTAVCRWSQLDSVLRVVGLLEFLKHQVLTTP